MKWIVLIKGIPYESVVAESKEQALVVVSHMLETDWAKDFSKTPTDIEIIEEKDL